MLLFGGPDLKWKPKIDDANPPRFYEPLPSGPYKGKTADKGKVEEDRKRYYEVAGWDENGIPKTETLRKLGLQDVDRALEKLR
jgi:aldehyde:ferredoxin oxidoreductase